MIYISAINSLRKTDRFGNLSYPVHFEWPKVNDLLLVNAPIEITDLKYKKSTQNDSHFGAI